MFTALAMAGAATAQAQVSWDAGSGLNFDWDVATNWSPDAVPTAATDVIFGTPIPDPGNIFFGADTILVGNASQAKSLTFQDAYTLTGGALTVSGGVITVSPNVSATINSDLTANNLTLTGNATDLGGGTLVLGGLLNNLTGTTSINVGTLRITDLGGLGASSASVASGATLSLLPAFGGSFANNVTLNGGSLSTGGAAITMAGNLNVQGSGTVLGAGPGLRLDGQLQGNGTLSFQGSVPETVVLAGNNAGFTGSVRPEQNSTVVFQSPASAVPVTLAGGTLRSLNTPAGVANIGVPGFNARYYNLPANPNATTNVNYGAPAFATRIDQSIDIPNQGSFAPNPAIPGLNGANVAAFWSGLINITAGGDYTFTTSSDDGTQVYIDGQLVVNHDGPHGVSSRSGTVTLTPGRHEIVYRFYQGTGSAAAKLEYFGEDTGFNNLVLSGDSGVVTNGKLAAINGGTFPITAEAGTFSAIDVTLDTNFGGPVTLQAGSTLRVTSPTISAANFNGAVTLQGNATLAGESGVAVFNGQISGAGATLTIGGPSTSIFNNKNTYDGGTIVSGGQLVLNATPSSAASPGNAIPGNLSIENGGSVQLAKSDQIVDSATVMVDGATFDLGANTESVANLTLQNNGNVNGSGTLTLPNDAVPQLISGTVRAALAGSNLVINKTGSEAVTFAGVNTYSGTTTISGGQLIISGAGNLGATGAGNGTVLNGTGELVLRDGANVAGEALTISRTGVSLRNAAGSNTFSGPITLSSDTSFSIDAGSLTLGAVSGSNRNLTIAGSGRLVLGGAINLGGGTFSKDAAGVLVHNVDAGGSTINVGAIPGMQIFNGTQTFTANTIAGGNTWQFNSPGSISGTGQTITIVAGGTMQPGYAIDQAFLGRINSASAGMVALTTDSANDLNFGTLGLNVGLGTTGDNTFSGNLVPNANTYRLGGGSGTLTVTSALGSAGSSMLISGSVKLTGKSTFGGAGSTVTVGAGSEVSAYSNSALGDVANVLKLDGGMLRFFNQSNSSVAFGSGHGRVSRTIDIGAGGGTIYIPNQNIVVFDQANTFTGTGTLTKTGMGEFQLVGVNDFAGRVVVGPNGGVFDVRAGGRMTGVTDITVNPGSTFRVQNNSSVGLFGVTNTGDRLNDAAVVNLRGGSFTFTAQNTAATNPGIAETVGTISVREGQSGLNVDRSGSGGATLTINTLNRDFGSFLRVGGSQGTLGSTGDHARIVINNWQMNGTAVAAPSGFIGGWATQQSTDFLAYNGSSLVTVTYTPFGTTVDNQSIGVPGASNFDASRVANITGVDVRLGTFGTGANFEIGSLRLADAATRQLLFANPDDRLFITGGGILGQDANNAKAIGDTFARGIITAGPATGNSVPRELFVLQQQNTMTINSNIVDNNQPVTLVKALDGTVVLTAPDNTYSGGTNVWRGTLQVNSTGGLGSGPVLVSGGRLQLQTAGTRTSPATGPVTPIEVRNGGEVFLSNSGATFNTDTERFIIGAGSAIMGNNNGNAGVGINSLTRVSGTPSAGGEVFLEAGAIVGHNTYRNDGLNGTGVNTIANLGANADLFYGLTGDANAGAAQSVTLGAGTPWMGISTDPRSSRAWRQGTIFANSDFTLQGTVTNGSSLTLTLGGNNIVGSYSIVNNSANPIRGFIVGNVALDENTDVSLPSDLTFVVTPHSTLQPNRVNSFGSGANVASVVVQAAGTLDPGNFGSASPTPTPGPVNAKVTIEGGGRLLLNDTSGFGTGGVITVQPEGIVEVASQGNALAGIDAGRFAFQPGSIMRLQLDNVRNLNTAIGGGGAILQVFGANRTVTSQTDPFTTAGPGSPNIMPEHITIGAGGGITNDSTSGRQLNSGRGSIVFAGDALIAGTTGSGNFSIQEDFRLMPGVTLTIGSATEINGNPKMGDIRLVGRASNTGDASTTIRVIPGQRLLIGTENVLPDSTTLDLQSGSTLVFDTGNVNEVIGALTGTGTVIGNTTTGNQALVVGWGASDFTFGGSISSSGTQQPILSKWGTSKMTLTGTSTSTGDLRIEQGEVVLAGDGNTAFGTIRPGKGATLTLDNSGTALNNRLNAKNISGQGGTVHLIGNATTEVDETIGVLNNGGAVTASTTVLKVTPGAALTTLTINDLQRFDNAGGRSATFVLQTPTLANLPGTYAPDNTYTPNATNLVNGLIRVNSPRFTATGGFDQNNQPAIVGVIGSPLAPMRPDVLADLNGDGVGDRFVTQESSGAGLRALADSEYSRLVWSNGTTHTNVRSTGTRSITGESRVQSLTMAAGSTLNVNGTLANSQQPARLLVTSGGIIVEPGAGAATIGGNGTHLQTNGGVSLYLHANSDLNLNAIAYSDTGIVKTGSGNLTFGDGAASVFRSQLIIDGGTVTLGGTNKFFQTREQNTLRGIRVAINGGTLDLNGNSQVIDQLVSANTLPYAGAAGGILTSPTPATVSVQGRGGSTFFSGQITGAISLDKVGANTLTLTNNNTMTGATSVRGGTLQLREEGTLSNTSGVTIHYGTLMLDNSSLSSIDNRIKAGVNVDMRGGAIDLRGGAGKLAQQSFGTVSALAGQVTLRADAGGGGASVLNINNLTRTNESRSLVNFTAGYGFAGTAGNDTTAVRFMVSNINGAAPAVDEKGMIGAWAIVNGDHFASYYGPTGIGALSNTADGYFAYESGDITTAADGATVNDSSSRTLSASKTLHALRYGSGSGGTTLSLPAGVTLTLASGGFITNVGQSTTIGNTANQGSITSGTDSLYTWINQNTTTFNAAVTGNIDLVKGGGGALTLAGNNTHTGKTYVFGGTLNLNTANSNGDTVVSIPGDLEIHSATTTVQQPQAIKATANVTMHGDSTLNLRDADNITETLNTITFVNNGGGTDNRPIVGRAANRQTSALNLTGANAITATNDNAYTIPAMSVNLGTVNFTAPSGVQTINVNAGAANPIGLLFNASIGTVPANPVGGEGGLVKTGNGVLVLNAANTFGSAPASLTPTFDIREGIVHASNNGALGSSRNHLTTIQSGAGLVARTSLSGITGSVRFKGGSFVGATEGNPVFGVATDVPTAQQIFEVVDDPALATDLTIYAADYWIQQTNGANITVHGKFTGGGKINIVGPTLAQGTGGGGVVRFSNPIASGEGSNDFSGTINVGTNTILESNRALVSGATSTTGSTLGNSTIELNGGRLRIREDFSTDNTTATGLSISYNHNVTLLGNSFIDANRSTGSHTSNTVALNLLNVPNGVQTLTVDSGNSYRVRFESLVGAGTLVKGGNSVLEIGAANNFAGSLAIAGPQGVNTAAASNLVLTGPTTVQNFTVNGLQTMGDQPFTVNGVLEVGSNAGTVGNGTNGVTTGSNTGALAIPITATLNFGAGAVLRNDGVLGSSGGEVVLNPSKIEGRGLYQTVGQPMTLAAPIADGASATTLKVAGNSSVNVTNANNTFTGGVEVQSGTLRVAPGASTATALGMGTIKVFGVPESTLGTNSQAVAASSGTLQFDGGASTISHSGNIQNSGLVHVASGTTQISGVISGSAPTYVPGLLEGRLTGGDGSNFSDTRVGNPGDFGIKLEPRMAQTNVVTQNPLTGWSDNEMWIYTGEFFDADGIFTFAEGIDDNVLISVDGVTRLLNNVNGANQPSGTGPWNTTTSTAMTAGQQGANAVLDANTGLATNSFGMGPNGDGWHTIEIRIRNGSGGAGGVFGANFGIGLNTDGTTVLDAGAYTRPVDPGDGSLFRTKVGGAGKITVESGSTLAVGGFNTILDVTLNGFAGAASTLRVTGGGSSDADRLVVGAADIDVQGNASVAVENLSVSLGGSLTKLGSGLFDVTAATLETDVILKVNGGRMRVNESLTGGSVNVTGSAADRAILGGSGTINAPVTLGNFAGLSPGKDVGVMEFLSSLTIGSGALIEFQAGNTAANSDLVKLTGATSSLIFADNWTLRLDQAASFDPTGMTFVLFDGEVGGASLASFGAPSIISATPFWNTDNATVSYDPLTNDIILKGVIPEPTTGLMTLAGLGSLLGLRRFRRRA